MPQSKASLTSGLTVAKRRAERGGTIERYRPIIKKFTSSMGPRAHKTIRGVTTSDLRRFRDSEVVAGKTAVTANLGLKVLRAAFEKAKREGILLVNPAAQVDALDEDGSSREPFSDRQIQRLLKVADRDWSGMILFGAHAGLRMSDAANLKWENVNLGKAVVNLVPKKTRRTKKDNQVTIALHPDIVRWLQGSKNKSRYLFPALWSVYRHFRQ